MAPQADHFDIGQALFISPRNGPNAHLSLLDEMECRILFGPQQSSRDSTSRWLETTKGLRYEVMPSLEELLNPDPVDPFPWSKGFEEVAHEVFVVLHTTGSTGLPKPVGVSHGLIATMDMQQDLPDVDGKSVTARAWANRSVYAAMPPFHSAGLNIFSFSVFQSTELVFGPSDKPPSLSTVEQILDARATDAAILPPSLLAEVAMDQDLLQKVSQWSSVAFGGGPLAQEAGDALWEQTKVLQPLGSTETNNIPELMPRSVDEWAYHCYHPHLGIEFRPHSGKLHELVFVRDRKAAQHQGAFWTFPDLDEYSMKDLYEQHPSKPGRWKYSGRLDDIIVLSNGEKFNPVGAERLIARDGNIRSALIVGSSREQPAVLIEPANDPSVEPAVRRASIVSAVEQANETLPAHAQIHASHIWVLDSSEAFLRSAKGEIRRAPTTDAFGKLIAQVYQSADDHSGGISGLDFSNEQSLSDSLARIISTDFLGGQQFAESDNFFECGFDSLLALKLLRYIKAGARYQGVDVNSKLTPRTIYQHPTALSLATTLMQSLEGVSSGRDESEDSLAEMQQMLDTFSCRLESLEKHHPRQTTLPKRKVVLLTGSTGSLGSYVLDSLIRNPTVEKIICLMNRAGSDMDKQARMNGSRGLCQNFSNVEFLQVDITKPGLGLGNARYKALVREASHIIHNAWLVDFNLSLGSFTPQLDACCHLIELAHASLNIVETTFMSSVGAANNWAHVYDGPVPEKKLNDFRVSEAMAYAQSKQLAELLFAHASQLYGLPTTVCRIGQIAGPVKSDKGRWNPKEWFPSVLMSCKALGKVPETLGAMDCMDWIPVDLLGDMLVEAVLPARNCYSVGTNGRGRVRKVIARLFSRFCCRWTANLHTQPRGRRAARFSTLSIPTRHTGETLCNRLSSVKKVRCRSCHTQSG